MSMTNCPSRTPLHRYGGAGSSEVVAPRGERGKLTTLLLATLVHLACIGLIALSFFGGCDGSTTTCVGRVLGGDLLSQLLVPVHAIIEGNQLYCSAGESIVINAPTPIYKDSMSETGCTISGEGDDWTVLFVQVGLTGGTNGVRFAYFEGTHFENVQFYLDATYGAALSPTASLTFAVIGCTFTHNQSRLLNYYFLFKSTALPYGSMIYFEGNTFLGPQPASLVSVFSFIELAIDRFDHGSTFEVIDCNFDIRIAAGRGGDLYSGTAVSLQYFVANNPDGSVQRTTITDVSHILISDSTTTISFYDDFISSVPASVIAAMLLANIHQVWIDGGAAYFWNNKLTVDVEPSPVISFGSNAEVFVSGPLIITNGGILNCQNGTVSGSNNGGGTIVRVESSPLVVTNASSLTIVGGNVTGVLTAGYVSEVYEVGLLLCVLVNFTLDAASEVVIRNSHVGYTNLNLEDTADVSTNADFFSVQSCTIFNITERSNLTITHNTLTSMGATTGRPNARLFFRGGTFISYCPLRVTNHGVLLSQGNTYTIDASRQRDLENSGTDVVTTVIYAREKTAFIGANGTIRISGERIQLTTLGSLRALPSLFGLTRNPFTVDGNGAVISVTNITFSYEGAQSRSTGPYDMSRVSAAVLLQGFAASVSDVIVTRGGFIEMAGNTFIVVSGLAHGSGYAIFGSATGDIFLVSDGGRIAVHDNQLSVAVGGAYNGQTAGGQYMEVFSAVNMKTFSVVTNGAISIVNNTIVVSRIANTSSAVNPRDLLVPTAIQPTVFSINSVGTDGNTHGTVVIEGAADATSTATATPTPLAWTRYFAYHPAAVAINIARNTISVVEPLTSLESAVGITIIRKQSVSFKAVAPRDSPLSNNNRGGGHKKGLPNAAENAPLMMTRNVFSLASRTSVDNGGVAPAVDLAESTVSPLTATTTTTTGADSLSSEVSYGRFMIGLCQNLAILPFSSSSSSSTTSTDASWITNHIVFGRQQDQSFVGNGIGCGTQTASATIEPPPTESITATTSLVATETTTVTLSQSAELTNFTTSLSESSSVTTTYSVSESLSDTLLRGCPRHCSNITMMSGSTSSADGEKEASSSERMMGASASSSSSSKRPPCKGSMLGSSEWIADTYAVFNVTDALDQHAGRQRAEADGSVTIAAVGGGGGTTSSMEWFGSASTRTLVLKLSWPAKVGPLGVTAHPDADNRTTSMLYYTMRPGGVDIAFAVWYEDEEDRYTTAITVRAVLLFGCFESVPVAVHASLEPPPPPVPVLPAPVEVASVIASVAGMAGSPDLQTLAILGLSSCSKGSAKTSGSAIRSIAPTAITNDCEGAIIGNFILAFGLLLLHGLAAVLMRFKKKVSWWAACDAVQYPSLSLMVVMFLQNGFFLCGFDVIRNSKPTTKFLGFLAVIWTFVPIIFSLITAYRLAARAFYPVVYMFPAPWRQVAGIILPNGQLDKTITGTVMFNSILGKFRLPAPYWVLCSFLSFIAAIPITVGSGSSCGYMYGLSAVLNTIFALVIVIKRPFRVVLTNIVQPLATLLNAIVILHYMFMLGDAAYNVPAATATSLTIFATIQTIVGVVKTGQTVVNQVYTFLMGKIPKLRPFVVSCSWESIGEHSPYRDTMERLHMASYADERGGNLSFVSGKELAPSSHPSSSPTTSVVTSAPTSSSGYGHFVSVFDKLHKHLRRKDHLQPDAELNGRAVIRWGDEAEEEKRQKRRAGDRRQIGGGRDDEQPWLDIDLSSADDDGRGDDGKDTFADLFADSAAPDGDNDSSREMDAIASSDNRKRRDSHSCAPKSGSDEEDDHEALLAGLDALLHGSEDMYAASSKGGGANGRRSKRKKRSGGKKGRGHAIRQIGDIPIESDGGEYTEGDDVDELRSPPMTGSPANEEVELAGGTSPKRRGRLALGNGPKKAPKGKQRGKSRAFQPTVAAGDADELASLAIELVDWA